MDVPAMFTRKQVPEDVGLRAEESAAAGGQGQLHRDEKEHKPVLKKVKEKVKKIKHTLAGNSHGHGHGDEHGRDERADDDVSSNEEEGDAALEREAAMEKDGYMEDVEDKPVAMESDPEVHGAPMYESERTPAVQDLVAKYDPQARAPAAREAHGADAPGVRFGDLGPAAHDPAVREARRDDPPKARLGDLGGPVVEDPAAPRSTTPAAREGEDIGATPVVQEFESMTLSDDPAHVGAAKQGAGTEEWKDASADKMGSATYTDRLKNVAAVPAEYGRKLASTVYGRVAGGGGPAVGTEKSAEEHTEAMPVSDAGADGKEWKDAGAPAAREAHGPDAPGEHFGDLGAAAHDPAVREARRDDSPKTRLGDLGGPVVEDPAAPRSTTPAAREGEDIGATPVVQEFESMTLSDDPAHVGAAKQGAGTEEWKDASADKMGSATYTDRLKNVAAVPAEYGRKLASTVYKKVASGGGPDVGTGKSADEHTEAMPVSDAGADGKEWKDAPAAVDTTDRSSGPGYTDKIKSAAAGTTEYGKQLASTAYDKVAGVGAAVAPSLRQREGAGKPEEGRNDEAVPVSDVGAQDGKDASATDATDSASGPGYTEKIKSAAAGTTEYGKQLASTVYEKVAGVGTAVVGKVQQATQSAGTATPGVGAQQQDTGASTVTPGDGNGQDKGVTMTSYISEKLRPGDEERALSSAISGAMQRRKEVGGTVGQRVPAPSQVITKAREAVTSLTGGNRVSETVQPNAATGADVKDNVGAEAPVLRGEEVGEPKLNTNTM